jgi:hypothetical protein
MAAYEGLSSMKFSHNELKKRTKGKRCKHILIARHNNLPVSYGLPPRPLHIFVFPSENRAQPLQSSTSEGRKVRGGGGRSGRMSRSEVCMGIASTHYTLCRLSSREDPRDIVVEFACICRVHRKWWKRYQTVYRAFRLFIRLRPPRGDVQSTHFYWHTSSYLFRKFWQLSISYCTRPDYLRRSYLQTRIVP